MREKQRGLETFGCRSVCLSKVAPKPARHRHRAAAASALTGYVGLRNRRFVIPAAAKYGRRVTRCQKIDDGIGILVVAVEDLRPSWGCIYPRRRLERIRGHWSSQILEMRFFRALDNAIEGCTWFARHALIDAPNAEITCSFPLAYSFGNLRDDRIVSDRDESQRRRSRADRGLGARVFGIRSGR